MTSVDEYANQVDTSAFTNAGVGVILDDTARLAKEYLGLDHPSNWSMIADKMDILTASSGVTLEYDGFNGTTDVKQADVVLMSTSLLFFSPCKTDLPTLLAAWPLEFNLSRENGLLNFAYYAGATSPNGPGMAG